VTEPDRHYGLMARFDSPERLVAATRQARAVGYRRIGAYTPFPVEELSEVLEFRPRGVPLAVLIGGIVGGVSGYALEYWTMGIAYPINVGGRPYNSWPMFIPVTFEMTVLFAGITALVVMLVFNGLPMPHHPVFAAPSFERVTRDGFFLCIEATDPRYDEQRTRAFLESLRPREVVGVPLS